MQGVVIAQCIRRWLSDQKVRGSIPGGGARWIRTSGPENPHVHQSMAMCEIWYWMDKDVNYDCHKGPKVQGNKA